MQCFEGHDFRFLAHSAPSHLVHAIHAATTSGWIDIAVVVVHLRAARAMRGRLCYCRIHTLRVL